MKIVVTSDTHGNNKDVINYLLKIERPDILFHLGDYERDGVEISEALGVEVVIVKGNCDKNNTGYKEEEIINLQGKKILLTHGHKYDLYNSGLTKLYYKALELEIDLVLFGHLHIPIIEEQENIIFMNPGSPTLPRSKENIKTFGLVTIENTINTKIIKIN